MRPCIGARFATASRNIAGAFICYLSNVDELIHKINHADEVLTIYVVFHFGRNEQEFGGREEAKEVFIQLDAARDYK